MAEITVQDLTKIYQDERIHDQVMAVDHVSFTCNDGEFMVLLGPSGCGKTSTLRMIAGLEEISAGKVFIGKTLVNDLAPADQNVAMAFENYALYPPLTVRENVVFPLKARGMPKVEIQNKLREVVDVLDIGDILDRRPAELSGGQQQRVSLGRCIIRDADVYLMDEPLSHLDSELRLRTRGELKRIHELNKRTVIYVTHDQVEALALADRIAVMDNGVLQQIGAPAQVYEHPINLFVAGFIGEPPMNFINGTISTAEGTHIFSSFDYDLNIQLPESLMVSARGWEKKKLVLGIRPHHTHMVHEKEFAQRSGKVVIYESLGEEGVLEVEVEGCPLTILTEPELRLKPRETVGVSVDWENAILFDEESGYSLNSNGD
ncbi:MAG: ABC transporter ATP-binding protein [Fidelibacterota bacterium]|nr:MAG: ABC transporter ATP-binding protein [Candidatus Neomarinimicrobiota bacterium]